MNAFNHFSGIKLLAAGSVLLLGGCLNGADQPKADAQAHAGSLKFIQESTAPLSAQIAADASGSNEPGFGFDHHDLSDQLDAIGCPKLGALFRDLFEYSLEDAEAGAFPQSFTDYLSCFGISATPTEAEVNNMMSKFQNPQQLLNCICGGTGLTDYLNANGFPISGIFEGSIEAASSSFDGSSSGASGSFEGSSDGATGSFEGSVKGGSGAFGD